LPLLAVARAIGELISAPRPATTAQSIGFLLALTALLLGALSFAFSIKYYLASALALALSLTSHSSGQVQGQPDGSTSSRIARRSTNGQDSNGDLHLGYYPLVSIHIAVYNERRVIERLLNACAQLDYPNYEVVVVDDSDDGSTELVERWRSMDRFKIIHRPNRDGFKGGALATALQAMDPRAEFVVVFDADALPFPDSIRRFLPHFYSNGGGPPVPLRDVAAVQSYQWHVLNKSESWLTEGVRTEYAGSYMVERPFQQVLGSMKMIAGTAYMIRAPLLRQLGWGRSLTEDWELTLRLYERGYKVVFTPYAETPAECVSTFRRLARQRMRWAEGHSHNVRKRFWSILRSPAMGMTEKLEFLYFSLYYLQSILFIVGSLGWAISELILRVHIPGWTAALGWSLLFTNLLALPVMNVTGLLLEEAPARDFSGVLGAMALSFLLVPFQAWASLKGLFERNEGPWFRTPKTGQVTDTIHHLRQLRQLRRWLKGHYAARLSPSPPPALAAVPFKRRAARGWWLVGIVTIALAGLAVIAGHAPVAYANPDQLYLRNTTSTVNAADQTLDVQGPVLATMPFPNGTSFTWLSATSYSSGTVTTGTYTFKLDWAANTCGLLGASACTITVTWGYCNSGCTTLQTAAATFTFTLNSGSGSIGTSSSSVSGSAITLTGCPCNFYVNITSSSSSTAAWTLAYNGNIVICTNQCDDTNIQTPTLPVSETTLGFVGVGLLAPLAARMLARRSVRCTTRTAR
jgi:cellulose synthase/poly-beta-1,6-N-acetylglucosamine synthase-like glycosyltransferase